MDVHTFYAEDYIARCVETLEQTGADNVGGPWVACGTSYLQRAIAAAFQSRFCAGGAKSHNPAYEGQVDSVYLGCWRRETLDRIGWFDSTLERNQDDEWNLRLIRAGGRIWQSARIRSWYQVRPSLRTLARQYFDYGFWKVAVIRKHRRPASWRHFAPAMFLLLNIALLPWLPALAAAFDLLYLVLSFLSAWQPRGEAGGYYYLCCQSSSLFIIFPTGLGFLRACLKTGATAQPEESVA